MPKGKLELTPAEIRVHLRGLLRNGHNLTVEQRYSLRAAEETIAFLEKLSPHFSSALVQMSAKKRSAQAG